VVLGLQVKEMLAVLVFSLVVQVLQVAVEAAKEPMAQPLVVFQEVLAALADPTLVQLMQVAEVELVTVEPLPVVQAEAEALLLEPQIQVAVEQADKQALQLLEEERFLDTQAAQALLLCVI
jgi:hypothetical protein